MRLSPAVLELDSMIVNIELTLTSIVQGVALTFLIENTRSVLSIHDATSWLYALTGLCIIFIFWSRSILHTLTLIRWPLEFGHNFLYIACTLAECLLFTCLRNPKAWFELSVVYGFGVWVLFAYDLRMTNVREGDPAGETSSRLCQLIRRDSWLNIRVLMPVLIVSNGLCAACLSAWPAFFIGQHGHVLANHGPVCRARSVSVVRSAVCFPSGADCGNPAGRAAEVGGGRPNTRLTPWALTAATARERAPQRKRGDRVALVEA
jgi:hypothetical protein